MAFYEHGFEIHRDVVKAGFKPVEEEISLEKLAYSIVNRGYEISSHTLDLIRALIGGLTLTDTDLFQYLVGILIGEHVANSVYVKESYDIIKSYFTEPSSNIKESLPSGNIINIRASRGDSDGGINGNIKDFLIDLLVSSLSREKGTISLINCRFIKGLHYEYTKNTSCMYRERYEDFGHAMEKWHTYFDQAKVTHTLNEGTIFRELKLGESRRDLIPKVLVNKGCRFEEGKGYCGDLKEYYALDTFHIQARQLTHDLKGRLPDNDHYKVLVKGPSGSCKSQWARSFAKYVLSPMGYLILIMDSASVKRNPIPISIPRVVVIVDEFSAENRTISSDIKEDTERLLRIFDDTTNNDIVPHDQPQKTNQSVIWLLTSNYEGSYDPAMERRLDIIRTFNLDSTGEKIGKEKSIGK